MSKAIELAEHYENKAKKFQPTGHARFRLNELTAELRRLAAVEQELADLKAAMGDPTAWLSDESVRRLARGGNDSRGTVPVHAVRSGVSCNPLYAIKAAK